MKGFIMSDNPRDMNESEWAGYVYDRHAYMMAGLRAAIEITDGEMQRSGFTYIDRRLDQRKNLENALIWYSKQNEELLEIISQGSGKKPLLAMNCSFFDDEGNLHQIVVKPSRREKIYNRLNKLLRQLLLS